MVDTDDTRRTTDDRRRTTPWVWHKLPTGELIKTTQFMFRKHLFFFFSPVQRTCSEKACIFSHLIVKIYIQRTSLFICSERARVIGELMRQRKALAAKQLDTPRESRLGNFKNVE